MTNTELQQFYINLLPIQWKGLPNASQQVGVNVQQAIADQIISTVWYAFDPATAIGAQLTILAGYVGAPRTIASYNPSIPYFELPSYAAAPITGTIGFASYTDVVDPTDYWLSYSTSQTIFVLTDGLLQQLIQYLIALHALDHTNQAIDALFQDFFGPYVQLTDGEDMTMTVTHSNSADPNAFFGIVNQLGLLPQPAGVAVSVVEV
jgi:hypothetical protein